MSITNTQNSNPIGGSQYALMFGSELQELFEGEVAVSHWPDQLIETFGFNAGSHYVEHFWLPILGPSCVILMRRLDRLAREGALASPVMLKDLSAEVGLGSPNGYGMSITRTINRLIQFDMGKVVGGSTVAVRTHLPPLNYKQQLRLPEHVARLHSALMVDGFERFDTPLYDRAFLLLLSMVEGAATEDEVINNLVRWRVANDLGTAVLEYLFPRQD
ncbi:MAG: hypothetical protein M0T78_03550 [Actinomycetota bacterium]|nr:hypothetical protein [Actinomycetota bacterium]